ncbi:hypothetical protein M6D93_05045 [Jatrophihabitans telluris]|uniref:LPXTG cell wall anchor domain-containing protein n=1 Tax=Jatrophihabitans telluris TaxID=2038343 RepID=A0ABY4R1I9_9ACTN|nr:hypothetical protein [Jatrophihabitans telluris]UQX89372.1 hypothetical protein M6D93_05045 [Jatrophihabitans telluris]
MITHLSAPRPSRRRKTVLASAVAGGALALVLGPLAGTALATTAYPPSDSCAASVVPGTSVAASTAPAACSTDTVVDATTSSAPASGIASDSASAAASTSTPLKSSNSGLAYTGTQVTVVAGLGALMVVGGSIIVVQGRRRHG